MGEQKRMAAESDCLRALSAQDYTGLLIGPDDAPLRLAEHEVHALYCNKAMSPTTALSPIPARPASQWPIGMRLRFKPDATLDPKHEALRKRPALVLSGMKLIGPAPGGYSWRQQVLALSTGRIGWARPDQLDLPLDGSDPESF